MIESALAWRITLYLEGGGDKIEAGRNSLLKEKKFPDTLSKELGAINVDFDGTKLGSAQIKGKIKKKTLKGTLKVCG
mgnify:CR=1 FL=1